MNYKLELVHKYCILQCCQCQVKRAVLHF